MGLLLLLGGEEGLGKSTGALRLEVWAEGNTAAWSRCAMVSLATSLGFSVLASDHALPTVTATAAEKAPGSLLWEETKG